MMEVTKINEVIAAATHALKKHNIAISQQTAKGEEVQVEIREKDGGTLCWRGWNFEPDFEHYLNYFIKHYSN